MKPTGLKKLLALVLRACPGVHVNVEVLPGERTVLSLWRVENGRASEYFTRDDFLALIPRRPLA